MLLNKGDETDSEGGLKAKVEIRGDRGMDIVSKEKERREGWRGKRKRTEGGNMQSPQPALCWRQRGGGGGPVNQPASCQHLPPAPPQGLLKPLS